MEDVHTASSEQLEPAGAEVGDQRPTGNEDPAPRDDAGVVSPDDVVSGADGGSASSDAGASLAFPGAGAPIAAPEDEGADEQLATPEQSPAVPTGVDPTAATVAGSAAESAPTSPRDGSGRPSRLEQLEREGEVAADFLERLLDIADLDGDIDVDIDGDRAAVAVVDSEEGRVPRRLVGPDGRVVEALQELTRLAVETITGERSRLMLDVAGFRAQRRAALVDLARAAIAEVKDSGQAKALADMTAFERKVVHDEVTAAGLVSQSEGVEPHRHIVISPR